MKKAKQTRKSEPHHAHMRHAARTATKPKLAPLYAVRRSRIHGSGVYATRRIRKGTRVIFVPGNHDEFARRYLGHNFGGVEVAEEWIHETADGRKLWITHGDLFDGVIQCAKWLAYVGDNLYEFTLKLNRHLNTLRARLGLPYWSL